MTTPLEFYAAPGTARRGLWRLCVGIVLILAGYLLSVIAISTLIVLYFHFISGMDFSTASDAMFAFAFEPGSQASVIFQLATFAGIWPATWGALKLLHGQPFATLLSPEGRMRWGDFGRGLALAAGFWVLTMVVGLAVVGMPTRTDLPLSAWLVAFAPLAVMVFLQASGEELIFRGYILQQLAARWRNPLIWAALPAFLFGLAHYSSGSELGLGWHYVAVTLLFGLAAAALVWRTGSLAAAMGLHTGMNLFSLSGVGLEGIIEGTQLFLYDAAGAEILFVTDGVATLAILLFVLSPLCPFRARILV